MAARIRSRPTLYTTGSGQYGVAPVTLSITAYTKTCTDVIGSPKFDHTLDIIQTESNRPTWNGSNGKNGYAERSAFGYPYSITHPGTGTFSAYSIPSLVTEVMARTNPARTNFQGPVSTWELRELGSVIRTLPGTLRLLGRSFIRAMATGYLTYEFGWKPLVSDFNKLLNFEDSVSRRRQELDKLYDNPNGLKRRVQLRYETYSVTSNPWYPMTLLFTASAIKHDLFKRRIWATIRWKPNLLTMPESDSDRAKQARQLAAGFHSSQIFSNLWEGLPWSWLIDWFTNFGDWITAINNTVGHVHGNVNIMVHTMNVRTEQILTKPSWVSLDPAAPEMTYERKQRFVAAPIATPQVSLPFLTNRQLSILGSLAILRKR